MKVNKYDRQVRIWGFKGQKKLTFAHVAIIGCSGPSIQAAKNLILPGIGRVDIFDNKKIQVEDLSKSFFFQHTSVGLLRGEVASKNLLEMNSDVQGEYKNVSVQQIIQSYEHHLKGYSLVICGNLLENQNKALSQICQKLNIPAIFISSVGFFFHIRSQKQLHFVQSENIASQKYYLRLESPFKQLQQYVNNKKLPQLIARLRQNKQNKEQKQKLESQFRKITYPIFLVECWKQLKQKNNKNPSFSEIRQLLNSWKQLVRQDPDVREGINQALKRYFDLSRTYDNFLSNEQILQNDKVVNADSSSEDIYIFLKSVKQFIKRQKCLPQIVRLPDISTSTKDFLQFKEIYKKEHQRHKRILISIIIEMFPNYMIDEEVISEYINNIDALQIVTMKPYYQQLQNPDTVNSNINYQEDAKHLLISIRSFKIFQQQNKRPPTPSDLQRMLQISQDLCTRWSITEFDQRFLEEICRYEGKSLISYDSISGSIAGQQGVKLITNCFTPMNNGYFFNGLKCKGHSLKL